MEKGEKAARVSSIFIYPVKSCRGFSVSHAPVTPTGFRWDRQWLVVNQKGRMYTQRVEPRLALVAVELPSDAFSESWQPTANSSLVLRAPGMNELKVSLSRRGEVTSGISCWEWSGSALDEGQVAADWFSKYLGKPSRLVRFNAASDYRPVDPTYASGHRVMFSDQYPYMLLSQGSLDALNRLLKEPISINRFRPKYASDFTVVRKFMFNDLWTEIRIAEFTFRGVKLCSRCKVPTINQETGLAGQEPNEMLKKFRSDKALRPTGKQQGKTYFGQNLVLEECPQGTKKVMKVGDPVSVVKMVRSAAEAAA